MALYKYVYDYDHDTIFDRTYWYSPYKRRRFENQTFCILLITDILSVIESANLRQRQN